MEEAIIQIAKDSIVFVPKLGIAILLFVLFWIAGQFAQKIFFRFGTTFDAGKNRVLQLAGRISKVALILLGAITALGTVGINVTALVAGLGLIGFALGFALKDAVSNVLSGALILLYQPFCVGDHITVSGCEGEVVDINLRYTVLQGNEKKYLIPNASLYTNLIAVSKKKS